MGCMTQVRRLYNGGCMIVVSLVAGFILTRTLLTKSSTEPLRLPLPIGIRDLRPDDALPDNRLVIDKPGDDGKNKESPMINEKVESSVNDIIQKSFDKGGDGKEVAFDMSRPFVRLWPDEEGNCGRLETRFGINVEWVWLISYPRSGNTWTRYLLEASTGIFTGSVYHSALLMETQYLGEKESPYHNTTVAVKTHKLPKQREIPAIMLIRNPMRSIVSYWNWKMVSDRSQRHTGSVSNDTLFSTGFQKFASGQISSWERSYSHWISKLPHLLPVYYEDLRDDPLKLLQQMLGFMKIKVNGDRLGCVASHIDGRFKGAQRSVDPYTPEQKDRLKRAVENISKQLEDRGFPPLPTYDNY